MVKVLLALSSYHGPFYADGAKTGVFLVEALHPFEEFIKSGAEVTFVSETGTFGWDEHSLSADFLQADDRAVYEDASSTFSKAIAVVKKASDVNAEDYDLFFAAGGHGCIFDLPTASDLHEVAAKIWKKNGVVSAVCHGPAIFDNLLVDGVPLIKGKKVTGFTDEGEKLLGLDGIMAEKKLETPRAAIEANGGIYVEPSDPWASFVVTDGKLVSGVNPASAAECAQKALEALS